MADMTRLLPAGSKPRGADLNALRVQLEAQRVTGAAGLMASQFSGGSTLAALGLPPVIRRTRADPFQPTQVDGEAKVTFEPGVIMGGGLNISPDVDGDPMATVPRPELTITTSGTIYIMATVDGAGKPTAAEMGNASSTPTDTATEKYLTTANVTLSGTTVTITGRPVRESRPLFVCNGTAIWD